MIHWKTQFFTCENLEKKLRLEQRTLAQTSKYCLSFVKTGMGRAHGAYASEHAPIFARMVIKATILGTLCTILSPPQNFF